jgi:predicted esterase
MKRIFISALAIICFSISVAAQDFLSPTSTYLYAQRDTCDLFLDIYQPAKGSMTHINGKEKPTVVFMFGGGFITGQRDNESYNKWFRQLTDNGYGVISIDYRLGLKGSNKVGIAQTNLLDKAIHMAVEDLFSATNFIIDNASELGVNPNNLVVSGSSAGAISVIQAEYEIANQTSWAKVLPEGFNYAGVMSFAGAIFSREGKVDFKTEPCPVMMLHGTADAIVPYTQIAVLNLGFFGGGKLVERFKKYDFNYNMYHFVDYGHEIASSMDTTLDLQLKFLENNVLQGKKRIVESWISDPDIYKGSSLKSRKDIYGN